MPLAQHSADAMGFANLIKAIDNKPLHRVINVCALAELGASLTTGRLKLITNTLGGMEECFFLCTPAFLLLMYCTVSVFLITVVILLYSTLVKPGLFLNVLYK